MILCCGEALIDMLPRQLTDGSNVWLPVAGGAVFNTATALGRLGVKTGFFSALSNDPFGHQLEQHLKQSMVDCHLCIRSGNPTTLAFVELNNGNANYTFYDQQSAGRMLDVDQLPIIGAEIEALHFGAISLIHEPCGLAYETLMKQASAEKVIAIDPNIRIAFIADESSHRARIRRMIGMSDIVKVSDEDLAWIAPQKDQQAVAEQWLHNGAAIVAVTKGAAGATAFIAGEKMEFAASPAQVVDTVGAGDSFNAGLLAGLQTQELLSKQALKAITSTQLVKAFELATKVAAITVSRAGADSPWKHELD